MKKRILLVNEASFLATGYSTYGKEIMARLQESGKYEIAELGAYAHHNDSRLNTIPWKVYCNLPDQEESQQQDYLSNQNNVFGAYKFEQVCLDFKPDICFSIRDFWMDSFIRESPFKWIYKHAWMPTVDAECQNEQWLDAYADTDAVLTYQDWSGETLKSESGGKINWLGSACPAASEVFVPRDQKRCRELLGLPQDAKIIGTVMRNQRRKLYPDLFKAFRTYLDESGRDDVFLYAHTSYPDNGWDIPDLIKENGLSSKVFTTYVCRAQDDNGNRVCQHAFSSTFQDVRVMCPRCGQPAAYLATVQHGIDTDTLATLYNCFDFYVQYANSEGMGMPAVEAAACGIPVAETDYSAMADVVRRIDGYPIKVLYKEKEMETGCLRARPDNDHMVEIWTDFFNMPSQMQKLRGVKARQAFEEYYSWDKAADKWMEVFDNMEVHPERWGEPAHMQSPRPFEEHPEMTNAQYARWLINEVLCETDKAGTYFEIRLIRDLNYSLRIIGSNGLYYNDHSALFSKPNYPPFYRKDAYDYLSNLGGRRNFWENERTK